MTSSMAGRPGEPGQVPDVRQGRDEEAVELALLSAREVDPPRGVVAAVMRSYRHPSSVAESPG